MKHPEELVRKMKEIRAQLVDLVGQGRTLNSEEVLAVSQELDQLVVAYQTWLLSKRSPYARSQAAVPPLRQLLKAR